MIRAQLVDDHGLVRDGLGRLLGSVPDIEAVAAAADGCEALALARERRPEPDELVRGVRAAALGESPLAPKAARELGISEKTVKAHLTAVFQRIGVSDRVQAAMWARDHNLG